MSFSATQIAALKRFKARETAAQTVYLKDKQVKLLCASWGFITRQITADKKAAPKSDSECWAWLWSAVKISLQELAYTTGGRDRVIGALAIARANRLIYPDGTLNQFVLQMITPELDEDAPVVRIEAQPKDLKGQKTLNLKQKTPAQKAQAKAKAKARKTKVSKELLKGTQEQINKSIIKPLL